MRYWFLLVLLGGALAWGGTRWRAHSDDVWERIAPGVEMRTLRAPGDGSARSIVALRTSPDRIRVAMGAAREAEAWRKTFKALAAVNGGYYDAEGKPLGLRASRGQKLNPLHGKAWGVFYTRGDEKNPEARIVATEKFKWRSNIRVALQCGPRLVENGKVLKLKPQWARRTGLGIQRDGRVIIAVADSEMSLPDWAKLWASPSGLNCPDALNLDGGPSSQLSLQTASRQLHLRSGRAVPDAVLISR
jgi:exopolysaccharide biosynthesis protein